MRRPLSEDELKFIKKLGAKIAKLRKERGFTQARLGEMIGQSQQQVNTFEKGRGRVPVTCLPALAEALEVSFEDLLGVQKKARRPGRTSNLERKIRELEKLPKSKQRFVSEMLDTVLQQAS